MSDRIVRGPPIAASSAGAVVAMRNGSDRCFGAGSVQPSHGTISTPLSQVRP